MKTNELLALFPKASLQDKPSQDSQKVSLRLDRQQWLVLATEDLTDREQQLLTLLTEKESVFSQNPWHRYGKEYYPLVTLAISCNYYI